MIKKAKSFVTLSLGVAITSQNMIISSADEVAILSDDEFKVKINNRNEKAIVTILNILFFLRFLNKFCNVIPPYSY